jgi:hypothetical protein
LVDKVEARREQMRITGARCSLAKSAADTPRAAGAES